MTVLANEQIARVRLLLHGRVQGVGFRPFAYRLAQTHSLSGWVCNTVQGVQIEVEGPTGQLSQFLSEVQREPPAPASVDTIQTDWLDPVGFDGFQIRASADAGTPTGLVPPDVAVCPECVREIFNPANRRFGHPFANCTRCGPRFTIIEALPYDRARTSMKGFALCADCRAEYENPDDRRFHAQPNSCPNCGPRLALWDSSGAIRECGTSALKSAAQALRAGLIVALKGLGGFQLLVTASDPAPVARLRKLKLRAHKPFAVMVADLAAARALCEVGTLEKELLTSPEAPIVLLRRALNLLGPAATPLAENVAPGNPNLGLMLPTTALHHLLLREFGGALVATSGNVRDEPLCIDEHEALHRLGGVADLFLVHDRPILRPVDDSVVRVVTGREMVLRRARGFAPLPISLSVDVPIGSNILAMGSHLRNTIALSVGPRIFLSQHLGHLETVQALESHHRAVMDLQQIHRTQADVVVVDGHPGYASTRAGRALGGRVIEVQHHHAHLLSCLADNGCAPPALGIIWDGSGDGLDGTIWGGEFLIAQRQGFTREGSIRSFPLPGGEAAVREPRRAALGMLYELFGENLWEMEDLPTLQAFTSAELQVLRGALRRGVNTPRTSSMGRLFDAVASLTGLLQVSGDEAQAAMELEFAAEEADPALRDASIWSNQQYAMNWKPALNASASPTWVADWGGLVEAVIKDAHARLAPQVIARRFHQSLADCVVPAAQRVGLEKIALSGGCFQNRMLSELTIRALRKAGFQPCWHRRVPPNDGGLALGQIVGAMQALGGGTPNLCA